MTREFVDSLSVRWTEKYDEKISKFWKKLPTPLKNISVFCAVLLLGISISGNWINLWVHLCLQINSSVRNIKTINNNERSFEYVELKGFWSFFVAANAVSFVIYLSIGGFLHWYYYVRQRDRAEEWKCQPNKFLTPDLEKHEIIFGSVTLFLNGTLSSLLACYIYNGGPCSVYYDIQEYGWPWFILQFVVIFVYQDYLTYWMHRIFHTPWLYKHFHKMHHKYKYPTAFSVTAIHPVESIFIQSVLATPLFLFPVHWLSFYIVVMYTYYHGIIDHSGINFKSYWWQPWQPDAIFHDNHHQYFHVNFGFNICIWDTIHGTCRQKERVYNEEIFYGKGKSLKEVTEEEIEVDMDERNSENPLAYRNDKLEYQLDRSEIEKIRH
ncbi:hypothetical protein HHI36_011792 [Cryptolaemus montrouzieri]|uniref:Fatty acid hydroxylase domain-containing protein n=1 Tax=Cryptolaemus montrouzieri TaxID=559131 RepID=A0ABD2NCD5_9CUCU